MRASSQATRLVNPLDPAYRDLQQLIDFGLVDGLSLGQRPLSRVVFRDALMQAGHRLADAETTSRAVPAKMSAARVAFLQEMITATSERLELSDSTGRPVHETHIAPLRLLSVDLTGTDEPTRRIPRSNGLGEIDATLNTLTELRQGRPLSQGGNVLIESEHALESPSLAIVAAPRFSMSDPTGEPGRSNLALQELQLRFLFKNLAFDLGREYVNWGQGRDAGLLNSNNSPPIDLIKVSSEQAFLFPWHFRHLGPTRVSLFYADLGADQNFPHAYAIAYRANIKPLSVLELGASVYTKSGGRGAPPATTTARLIDLLPFLDASAYNNVFGTRGDFAFSDHYAGFDGRMRLPSIASSMFWEVLLNDFDVRRLKSVFWEDAGHIFGVDLPPLTASGRVRGSLEYHHTGIRYYEHQQFTSGQTVHHLLTGDPLGPNAQAGYLNLDWFASAYRRLGVQLAVERRSNDQYAFVPEPHFGFTRVQVQPKEWRRRVIATWQVLPLRAALGGLIQMGYERARNFDFVQQNQRNSFLGRIAVQYRFN